jgi:hypothetical protein
MIKFLAMVSILFILASPVWAQGGADSAQGKGFEVRTYATYLWPQADEPWTHAEGGEIQWAWWMNSNFGACLAVGAQHWKASFSGDDTYTDPQSGFALPMHHEVSGYAVNLPLGGSVLGRLPFGRFALTGELGARFVPVVSQVKYSVSVANPLQPGEPITLDQTITIKPPVIAIAAADVEYKLTATASLYAGGGYQYDLVQPELEIDTLGNGTRTESNEMKAFFARAGGLFRF